MLNPMGRLYEMNQGFINELVDKVAKRLSTYLKL